MTCHEVALAEARCLVTVRPQPAVSPNTYVAQIDVVDDDARQRRPLVAADGCRLEVHAESETLALNSAIAFLASVFGGLSETAHACTTPAQDGGRGEPWHLGPDDHRDDDGGDGDDGGDETD